MKFTEALQKCWETPGEIYIKDVPDSNIKVLIKYDVHTKSILYNTTESENPNINNFFMGSAKRSDFEADWRPFLKEVTWQEAIEALLYKDVRVKCICKSNSYVSALEMDYYSRTFDDAKEIISGRLITNGKWYILEE